MNLLWCLTNSRPMFFFSKTFSHTSENLQFGYFLEVLKRNIVLKWVNLWGRIRVGHFMNSLFIAPIDSFCIFLKIENFEKEHYASNIQGKHNFYRTRALIQLRQYMFSFQAPNYSLFPRKTCQVDIFYSPKYFQFQWMGSLSLELIFFQYIFFIWQNKSNFEPNNE